MFDCGVREPECPTGAIFAGAQPGLDGWPKLNGNTPRSGQTLLIKREQPADAAVPFHRTLVNAIEEGKLSEKLACAPDHDQSLAQSCFKIRPISIEDATGDEAIRWLMRLWGSPPGRALMAVSFFTIGHSRRTLSEFVELLRAY